MRILILVHGNHGQRIVHRIQAHYPPQWQVDSLSLPRVLPPIVDKLVRFLPPHLGPADLVLPWGSSRKQPSRFLAWRN